MKITAKDIQEKLIGRKSSILRIRSKGKINKVAPQEEE